MSSIDELSQKVITVKTFKGISRFINDLIENMYTPVIFINVKEIIMSSSDSHSLTEPDVIDIIQSMKKSQFIKNIIFVSDKNENYRQAIYNQILSLTNLDDCILLITNGKDNIGNFILNYLNIKESSYKPWILYIDQNPILCNDVVKVLKNIRIKDISAVTFQSRNWQEYFYSIIYGEKYAISDVLN